MPQSSLPRRVVLLGYFDRGNVGDDLMRDALFDALPRLLPAWSHIEARRLPQLSSRGLLEASRLLAALVRADLVLLAGGSHFHDRFGWRSMRILAVLLGLFAVARLGGAQVGFAGIGVGPLGGRASRFLVGQLLRIADAVLVRDHRSARLARRLARDCAVIEGLDLAFLLAPAASDPPFQPKLATLGISVIPYFGEFEGEQRSDDSTIDALATALAALACEVPLRVLLLPLFDPPGEPSRSDRTLSERLATLLAERGVETGVVGNSVEQVRQDIEECDVILATRYHAALLAYVAARPTIVVEYDAKCTAFAEQLGLPAEARLRPLELLDHALLEARLRALLTRPDDFDATLALDEAREQAAAGLRIFADALLNAHRARVRR